MASKRKSRPKPKQKRQEAPAKPLPAPEPPQEKTGIIRPWPWAVIFIALSALHLTCASSEIGGNLGGDSVVYYLLGKALATGHGYVDLYLPAESAHTKYPFLFPLLLAPFHLIFKNPLLAMHVMLCLFNAAAATALGVWAGRRHSSRNLGILFAALFGTIPYVYLQSLHLLTEPVYMAFCFFAILALPEKNAGTGLGLKRFIAVAFLVIAAYFTRSAGIALLPAVAFELWRVKARVALAKIKLPAWVLLIIIFVLPAALWSLRNHFAGEESAGYVSEFILKDPYRADLGQAGIADLGRRFLQNSRSELPVLSANALAPVKLMPLHLALYLLPLVLVVVGLVRELIRGRGAAELFFILSLFIVLVWPFQEVRFLIPLMPLAGFYALSGLAWAGEAVVEKFIGKEHKRWVMPAAAGVFLVVQLFLLSPLVKERLKDNLMPRAPVMVSGYGEWSRPVTNWANYDLHMAPDPDQERRQLTGYLIINRVLGELTPPNAVILSRKQMWTYFLTNRKSVPIIQNPRPEFQWQYMIDNQVDYLVTGFDEATMADTLNQSFNSSINGFETVAVILPEDIGFNPAPPILIFKVHRERINLNSTKIKAP